MAATGCGFCGVLLDVDGVLWIAGAPGAGALALLDRLQRTHVPFCLLTNTCNVSKADRHESLLHAGFAVTENQLVTAAETAGEWLRAAGARTIMYLGAPQALPDVATGLCVRKRGPVDAVVVGDLFSNFDRNSIDGAAKAITDGATLVAMHRNPRWSDGLRSYVDNGFWVAGFEYVTGVKAIVTGKPNGTAYLTALERLGLAAAPPATAAFVSDDVTIDLKGAKDVGLTTVYFGPTQPLPAWVDYAASDMWALESLLIGHHHD